MAVAGQHSAVQAVSMSKCQCWLAERVGWPGEMLSDPAPSDGAHGGMAACTPPHQVVAFVKAVPQHEVLPVVGAIVSKAPPTVSVANLCRAYGICIATAAQGSRAVGN